ncbi:MAG: hypothetical protein LBU34_00820 [Planctomycetaceae bacterium]|nr:hypothetical protein [Planctomycetaceae bacterium]
MCITGGGAQRNRRITTPKNISPARGEIIRQHNHNLALAGRVFKIWGFFYF